MFALYITGRVKIYKAGHPAKVLHVELCLKTFRVSRVYETIRWQVFVSHLDRVAKVATCGGSRTDTAVDECRNEMVDRVARYRFDK